MTVITFHFNSIHCYNRLNSPTLLFNFTNVRMSARILWHLQVQHIFFCATYKCMVWVWVLFFVYVYALISGIPSVFTLTTVNKSLKGSIVPYIRDITKENTIWVKSKRDLYVSVCVCVILWYFCSIASMHLWGHFWVRVWLSLGIDLGSLWWSRREEGGIQREREKHWILYMNIGAHGQALIALFFWRVWRLQKQSD